MKNSDKALNDLPFLQGGGQVGTLMRNKDWSQTLLGSPDQWPIQLKQLVATMLNTPTPMLILWSNEYIQLYNDAFLPVLGMSKHPQALGASVQETLVDNWDTLSALLEQLMQGELVNYKDFKLYLDKNDITANVSFDFSYSAIKNENAETKGILVICKEATEQVKSVKRPEGSEELFDAMADSNDILVAIGDAQGNTIYLNNAWGSLTGKNTQDLYNNGWIGLIHPEDKERFFQSAMRAFAQQMSYKSEFRIRGNDGEYHLLLGYSTARFNSAGEFLGYIGICTEITEQARHQYELKRAFEQLHLSKEAAQLGTFDLDLEKGTLEWDARCRILFGITHKEEVSYEKDFVGGLHPNDRERILYQIDRSFMKSVSNGDYDVEYRTVGAEDGLIRWVKAKGKVFFDKNDKPIRFIGSVLDITEQKNASQKLEESEARFRALIEEAPVATCLFVGRNLIVEIANEEILNIWGKGNSVFGKPLAQAIPELEGQPFLEILDNIFTTGIAYSANSMRADLVVNGVLTIYYFDFTYKPLFNKNGEVYAIITMAIDATERVLSQQRIERTQRELLSSFEEAPVAIATINTENLTFKIVNSFYAALVGRKREELIGKPLLEALPELIGQGFDDLLRNVIATGNPYVAKEVRAELIRKGKLETIYVDLAYQPRYEGNDNIVGVLVVATDITEQVIARKKIEESETKLRSILSSAPAGIGLYVGKDFIIESPNQTFIELMGKGPDIVGKPLKEVMPELITENQPFLQILSEVYETGQAYHSSGSLAKIVRNGIMTDSYFNITYTPVFNTEGEVYAILEIAVDVNEQVKAQQALEEAEAELRGAIELAGLATWKLDIKQQTFKYSPRFMEWLGFTEDTRDLDAAYNPLPGKYRELVPVLIQKAISGENAGMYEYEHPIVNRTTGQVRIIHAQGQVFYDASGAPAVLSGTTQDITLQREMQMALEAEVKLRTKELDDAITKLQTTVGELAESNTKLMHSNAELAQFAYIASHDLQEPLRKIITFSQLLEKGLGENVTDESKGFLAKIKNSSTRMTALIRDVLMYSQLVKEKEIYERVNLNQILENILSDYYLLIEQKGAVVKQQELPIIEAIPLQMTQLFANLIGNALKFVAKDVKPILSISAKKVEKETIQKLELALNSDYYNIRFADNGIGIPDEYVEKVFNIFQRLHRKSEYEGTGIGLAMCKKIVQNHQGYIGIENNPEGGTIFNVILPVKQAL